MKKNKKKTISFNILIHFIIFTVILLAFLWIFQIVSLNTYYKYNRKKALNSSASYLSKNYQSDNYKELFDETSINSDVCIEVVRKNKVIYSSREVDKKCMSRKNIKILEFQTQFMEDDNEYDQKDFVNPNFNNETLVIGKKLDKDTYMFVNTSLVPLDNSIRMLKKQFKFTALIMIIISSIISYFISKRLTIPIVEMSNKANSFSDKNYDIKFDEDTNILEIDELGSTLNRAASELAKTDELRRELMANISHDLKTPLTLIRAYAEAARDLDYNKKDKREKDLNVIVGETERLTLLVNDILELSKYESNIMDIKKEDINLKSLIDNIINKFGILKNDGFVFKVNCDKNIIINSDYLKIERVIYNLVNNAINFTGDDKLVTINVIKQDDYVRVEIIDTGDGINPDDLKIIWDKYRQVDKQHKRNKYGTGLGLSIVKSILTSLDYNYGVNSKKGHGTTFYFEIN
jgi:signal transduction histidine kinase